MNDQCTYSGYRMNVRLFFVYLCIFSNILYTTYAQDIDECTRGSDNCDNNADCTNTIGSFTCQCKNGYSGNGVSCSDIDDCTRGTDNCHNNADCTNTIGSFTCQCKDGYSGNGVSCSEINECQSVPCKNGGTCTDLINAYRCTCVNGYSSTNCEVAAIGASCSQSGTYCSDPNGFCQSNGQGEQTCQCKSMHYDNDNVNNIGGICTSKVGLGQNCPMPNACFTSNSECVGDTCRCTNNYYDTNIATTDGGSCESRHNLGEVCSKNHSNTKQCVDPNATCRGSSYICSCDDRYHKEGSRCVPNVALCGTCTGTADAECSDPNAECGSTKCTCSVGYYRLNGSNSQSNCKDVTELRVTGITFSNVQTTEFTVSWTAPSRSSYVSGYDVEWQSGSTIEGASSPRRVSGLIPGKRYDVKVISKDTTTQPGVTRTTYSSKEQATTPGKVSDFNIEYHPGGNYSKMKISWKMPTVLERNGIIARYKFEHFETTMVTDTKKFKQEAEGFIYTITIDVTPEKMYNITVYAINEGDVEGEKNNVLLQAPAGVPISIEETQHISVIPKEWADAGHTTVTVFIEKEFFEEATNGEIQGTGLILCTKKDCTSKDAAETLSIFDQMKNWKEDKEMYRATNKTWLTDTIQMNNAGNSRKRCAVTELQYTVGSDKCPELTSGQYCNGPLQLGKSYYIFAVSCTNGGCLVSQPNGPFITKTAKVTDDYNCATQSIVIGVVLGLTNLILFLYAGYTTIIIRRFRAKGGQEIPTDKKKGHNSQTYVNESFSAGASCVPTQQERANGDPETEYSTLDDKSRDCTTYDRLRPGH